MESGLDELTRKVFGFTKNVISISFMDEMDVTTKMLENFKNILTKSGVEILNEYVQLSSGFAQFTVTNLSEADVYNLFPLLTDPNNRINSIVSKAVILLKSERLKDTSSRSVVPQDLTLFWGEDSQFYRIK